MYEALLILHFLALAAGVGASIFMAALGAGAAKLAPEEAGSLMLRAGNTAGKLGGGALVLLILSGLALTWLTDGALVEAGGWWFRLKIVLVVVLAVLIGLVHRQHAQIRRGADPRAAIPVLQRLGAGTLVTGVLIVILAVIAFA
jgi:hypothetical protein